MLSETRCDPDPWAAFNLRQRENIAFFSARVLGFLPLRRRSMNSVCFAAALIRLALCLSREMKLMRGESGRARLPAVPCEAARAR